MITGSPSGPGHHRAEGRELCIACLIHEHAYADGEIDRRINRRWS
jgi:hypothetical protein